MNNKELDEILQKYAESTKSDPNTAFKKLNEKIDDVKHTKKFKWQYVLAAVASIIIIVLSITLPTVLTDDVPQSSDSTYCDEDDIIYNLEVDLAVLINEYGLDAHYPTYSTGFGIIVRSISSRIDITFHGALIGMFILEDNLMEVEIAIIPKTHILQTYEDYFTLTNEQNWSNFTVKFEKENNSTTELYDIKVYFTDGKYDYFISANSDQEVEPNELLDILYN